MLKIVVPIGFCFGVNNSINQVKDYSLSSKDKEIVFLRQIVHDNNTFNKILTEVNGTKFDKDNNYNYSNCLFVSSAHGVIKQEQEYINSKNGIFLDTTCPILLNTKKRIRNYLAQNRKVIFIGKKDHDETISFLSEFSSLIFIDINQLDTYPYKDLKDKYYIVFQSTISLKLYKSFLNKLKENNIDTYQIDSICRQCLLRWNKASHLILEKNDCFIVLGSLLSSNGKEFYNLLKSSYPNNEVLFIQDINSLNEKIDALRKCNDIYLCSATSFSNEDVDLIVSKLKKELNIESIILEQKQN